jgi:hypothetical protein
MVVRGNTPTLIYALGRSEFESGDTSCAVTTLTELIRNLPADQPLRKIALDLRERALQSGGTLSPTPPEPPLKAITREEFEHAFEEFAQLVKTERRMHFWVSDGRGKHKWISAPEKEAKHTLHTFLKAKWGSRVDILEEPGAGAGRIDLYVQFDGGLAVILELKMCGSGYSSTYAASGEHQITHYMDNRRSHLGYLIVFDARKKLFGAKILTSTSGPHTVIERIIDVRSRVSED